MFKVGDLVTISNDGLNKINEYNLDFYNSYNNYGFAKVLDIYSMITSQQILVRFALLSVADIGETGFHYFDIRTTYLMKFNIPLEYDLKKRIILFLKMNWGAGYYEE